MPRATDADRVYCYLLIVGPQTLAELRSWCNWTTHRTNSALCRLVKAGDARLVQRNSVQAHHTHGYRYCGLWEAIPATEVRARKNCEFLEAVGS